MNYSVSGQTGGIEITSSFQAIRADIDTVDSQDSLVQNQETDHSGAVTISIGPSTKLHVNEESSLSEKKYVSLSNLESRTRHEIPHPVPWNVTVSLPCSFRKPLLQPKVQGRIQVLQVEYNRRKVSTLDEQLLFSGTY